jgi:hypothetical protein
MPTSPYSHIDTVVNYLYKLRPSSVLDIGIGNGKMGFIARDFLDVMLGGAYRRETWQVRIDGIEIFSHYIQDHQKALYNTIHIGDAFEVIDSLPQYDLIILSDVLEHFTGEKAWMMMDKCAARAKHIILNIPLGETWTQGAIYGNSYEAHLSFWKKEAFQPFVCAADYHSFEMGEYGCFLIDTRDYLAYIQTGEPVRSQVILETKRTMKPHNVNDR